MAKEIRVYQIEGGPGIWGMALAMFEPNRELTFRLWRDASPQWEDAAPLVITGIKLHECYPDDRSRFLLEGYSEHSFLTEGKYNRVYFEADYHLHGNTGTLKVTSVS